MPTPFRAIAALGLLALTLACGGVGGASPRAVSMCEHLTKTHKLDTPCQALTAGSTVLIDDIEVTVDKVSIWKGFDSLPEVSSSTERKRMAAVDSNTLAVELSYTNTKPVKSGLKFKQYGSNGDGDEVLDSTNNNTQYRKDKEGWIDIWDDDDIGPGKTRQGALVFAMKPSAVEGTLLILRKNEKRPDPDDPAGRRRVFTKQILVLDLGPPT